jgi:hypothetical protein
MQNLGQLLNLSTVSEVERDIGMASLQPFEETGVGSRCRTRWQATACRIQLYETEEAGVLKSACVPVMMCLGALYLPSRPDGSLYPELQGPRGLPLVVSSFGSERQETL